MKKFLLYILSFFVVSSSYALPSHAVINFTLSEIIKGNNCPATLMNVPVVIDYDYNFEKEFGQAHLRKMKNVDWSERLFPLGISKYYGFMSSMKPKTIEFSDGPLTIFRIIFHLYKNGESKLMMMVGENGDCIVQSDLVQVSSS